jgi:hypothetical protein
MQIFFTNRLECTPSVRQEQSPMVIWSIVVGPVVTVNRRFTRFKELVEKPFFVFPQLRQFPQAAALFLFCFFFLSL